jgi:hypothetical protein
MNMGALPLLLLLLLNGVGPPSGVCAAPISRHKIWHNLSGLKNKETNSKALQDGVVDTKLLYYLFQSWDSARDNSRKSPLWPNFARDRSRGGTIQSSSDLRLF